MGKSLLGLFLLLILGSCEKEYQCACTDVISGDTVLRDNYKGTSFKKKSAQQACKSNNNVVDTTITNCHIK